MMKNKRLIAILAALVILVCGGFAGYKFYTHERNQSRGIALLQEEVKQLSAENRNLRSDFENLSETVDSLHEAVNLLSAEIQNKIAWTDDAFNYLAIGNSITRHGRASYWWNNANGMAASDAEHDYFHLVLRHLEEKHGKVHGETAGLSTWEVKSHDRDEMLTLLNPWMNEKIDLITIQLGENTDELETFEADFVSLIQHIKAQCPKARVIVIGDFWECDGRDAMKKAAAEQTGVEYVSLEGIKGNPEYYCGMGTTVYDEEGNAHTVNHDGVAVHPGDRGMQAIAERVIALDP